jgi:hypothetical protein
LLKRFGLFILVGYVVSGGVAHAATYYVSRGGSNNNSCAQAKSPSTPKQTIAAGISCLSGGGDTLLIRAGTYDEILQSPQFLTIASGTSWSNKVRIAAYPGETVWVKPSTVDLNSQGFVIWIVHHASYIEFDGINVDGTLVGISGFGVGGQDNFPFAHHIRYQNAEVIRGDCRKWSSAQCETDGIGIGGHIFAGAEGGIEILNNNVHGTNGGLGYGIYVAGPNNLIDGNNIHHTSVGGIQVYNGGGDSPDNNIVRNNRIHDITDSHDPFPAGGRFWGILVAGNNNLVYNNLLYNNDVGNVFPVEDKSVLGVFYGTGNKFYNNTAYNNNAIGVKLDVKAENTEVKNNIVYAGKGSNIINFGNRTVQSNNLFDVDPLFVSPSAGNFQLQPGSKAIDAGASLSIVTTDFMGGGRPEGATLDIGAYEYRPAQAASAPPVPTGLRILAN